VIEIDGMYHDNEETYTLDVIREEELKKYDLTILRFSEHEVKKDIVNVLRTIEGFVLDFKEKHNI
jgi:very-short-patch-repair endonuclease